MIASVLKMTRADWRALRIRDAYGIHKAVYSLFPAIDGQSRDFLYVDKGGDHTVRQVLILSRRFPESPQRGTIECKEIPSRFLTHSHYGFELRLNPVKRDASSGKIVPILGKENLASWFLNKAPDLGFRVDETTLEVNKVGIQSFQKEGETVVHSSANFLGKLQVIDHGGFVRSFEEGIGRAKAFGFGLLQIIPLAG